MKGSTAVPTTDPGFSWTPIVTVGDGTALDEVIAALEKLDSVETTEADRDHGAVTAIAANKGADMETWHAITDLEVCARAVFDADRDPTDRQVDERALEQRRDDRAAGRADDRDLRELLRLGVVGAFQRLDLAFEFRAQRFQVAVDVAYEGSFQDSSLSNGRHTDGKRGRRTPPQSHFCTDGWKSRDLTTS